MRWTERQRAMLREIGVQLWSRELAVVDDEPSAEALAPRARAPRPAAAAPAARVDAERTSIRADRAPELPRAPAGVAALQPADWLVVGEPLDPTDRQQEQLLDNLLRAIGVSRTAPTRTGRAAFVALAERSGASPALPGTGDSALLAAAISAAAPRCAIALGRAAAAALLDSDEPLGTLRGRRHARGDVPVVVTFSLAFLLRHPAEKAKAWLDLCLAVSTSEATSG